MTTPNKFESAARLQRALDKLDAKFTRNLDAVQAKHIADRESILAAADPEARKMAEAEDG